MENNAFIYVIWGIYPTESGYKDSHWFGRRSKIDNDIQFYLKNPYSPKGVFYTFGSENYKRLTDSGLNCVLVDKRPFVVDMEKEQYGMKLLGWKSALEDYKSIVGLDIDTCAIKPLPTDFWQVMDAGEPVRSTIYLYHRKRVDRMPNDMRKVSSASMVYIRGEHGKGIVKQWEDMDRYWKEEIPLSKYIDNLNGGWKGIEGYKKYDIPYYQLQAINGLEKCREQLAFSHYNKRTMPKLLNSKDIKNDLIKYLGRI